MWYVTMEIGPRKGPFESFALLNKDGRNFSSVEKFFSTAEPQGAAKGHDEMEPTADHSCYRNIR